MNKTMRLAMVMAAWTVGLAAAETPTPATLLCLDGITDINVRWGARQAGTLFGGIGVRTTWLVNQPCPAGEDAIRITFVTGKPAGFKPGALAYAYPFEGTHIVIMLDRVRTLQEAIHGRLSGLLAYVLAHEVTHILQGFGRHSESGIMRANWTLDDQFLIKRMSLTWTPEDVEWIRRGVAQREQAGLLAAR